MKRRQDYWGDTWGEHSWGGGGSDGGWDGDGSRNKHKRRRGSWENTRRKRIPKRVVESKRSSDDEIVIIDEKSASEIRVEKSLQSEKDGEEIEIIETDNLGEYETWIVTAPKGALVRKGMKLSSERTVSLASKTLFQVIQLSGRRAKIMQNGLAIGWISLKTADGKEIARRHTEVESEHIRNKQKNGSVGRRTHENDFGAPTKCHSTGEAQSDEDRVLPCETEVTCHVETKSVEERDSAETECDNYNNITDHKKNRSVSPDQECNSASQQDKSNVDREISEPAQNAVRASEGRECVCNKTTPLNNGEDAPITQTPKHLTTVGGDSLPGRSGSPTRSDAAEKTPKREVAMMEDDHEESMDSNMPQNAGGGPKISHRTNDREILVRCMKEERLLDNAKLHQIEEDDDLVACLMGSSMEIGHLVECLEEFDFCTKGERPCMERCLRRARAEKAVKDDQCCLRRAPAEKAVKDDQFIRNLTGKSAAEYFGIENPSWLDEDVKFFKKMISECIRGGSKD